MVTTRWLPVLGLVLGLSSCRDLDRFDTAGAAEYCGSIVGAQFVRTPLSEGGFQRRMRLAVRVDVDHLTDRPGSFRSDDASDGPCTPSPTFDDAPLQTVRELASDPLSTLTFGETQERNLVTWVESTCRGPMLSVVSLLKDGKVDVRLLRPPPDDGDEAHRAAFSLFKLTRHDEGCDF